MPVLWNRAGGLRVDHLHPAMTLHDRTEAAIGGCDRIPCQEVDHPSAASHRCAGCAAHVPRVLERVHPDDGPILLWRLLGSCRPLRIRGTLEPVDGKRLLRRPAVASVNMVRERRRTVRVVAGLRDTMAADHGRFEDEPRELAGLRSALLGLT